MDGYKDKMTCVWESLENASAKKKKGGRGGGRDRWKQDGKTLATVEPEQKVCMAYVILPSFVSVFNFP